MSDVREHKRVYKLVEKWSANRENGLASIRQHHDRQSQHCGHTVRLRSGLHYLRVELSHHCAQRFVIS
jgi:hypothetical protein